MVGFHSTFVSLLGISKTAVRLLHMGLPSFLSHLEASITSPQGREGFARILCLPLFATYDETPPVYGESQEGQGQTVCDLPDSVSSVTSSRGVLT